MSEWSVVLGAKRAGSENQLTNQVSVGKSQPLWAIFFNAEWGVDLNIAKALRDLKLHG